MRRLIGVLIVLFAVPALALGASSKPSKQHVYMFGVAASFVDSLCVMTDLQDVEAYVMPNGFLADRSLYSLQLNNHLVANQNCENLTCVVYFSKKKAKAEKKYQKLRKRYREDESVLLQQLGIDIFRFETEEWLEPENVADSEKKPDADKKGQAKKKMK